MHRFDAFLQARAVPGAGAYHWFPNIPLGHAASGQLPQMVARAADMHAREAERRTLFLTSLLEPAPILFIGAMVMLIVLAVLMQINQLVH
jgi:hypothetical protein